jgi:hypothetical protein
MHATIKGWTPGARQAANFLASMPAGHTTLERDDLRSLLSESGGQLMARGVLYDIISKHLGAGVYRVSMKEWRHG